MDAAIGSNKLPRDEVNVRRHRRCECSSRSDTVLRERVSHLWPRHAHGALQVVNPSLAVHQLILDQLVKKVIARLRTQIYNGQRSEPHPFTITTKVVSSRVRLDIKHRLRGLLQARNHRRRITTPLHERQPDHLSAGSGPTKYHESGMHLTFILIANFPAWFPGIWVGK